MVNKDESTMTYIGTLNVARPMVYRRGRGGSARSSRFLIYPDKLIFQPFGFFRGIFHEIEIIKDQIVGIYQSVPILVPLAGAVTAGLLIERPLDGSRKNEQIQFFPRKVAVGDLIGPLETAGYIVDPRPKRQQIFG